jgi:hypothetical protein
VAGRLQVQRVTGDYSVSDGALTMRDGDGKPNGKQRAVGPDEDPHHGARFLGRWTAGLWIGGQGGRRSEPCKGAERFAEPQRAGHDDLMQRNEGRAIRKRF